jgi:two-component system OmpR family response regulator
MTNNMNTTKRKILLIDNDVVLSKIVSYGLGMVGYEARVENDSSHALLAVRAFMPDLILLDVVMPDMDGGAVAQQLRAKADIYRIPIIYFTSMVSKEEAARLAEQGERYLCKPTSIVMLKQYIETFFSDNLYGVGNVSR